MSGGGPLPAPQGYRDEEQSAGSGECGERSVVRCSSGEF